MTVPVLQVQNLTVALPRGGDRREAVSGVSFEIPQGQLVCLVGESGSGKSVIAHTVMGLTPRNLRPTAGEVRVNGEALLQAAPRRLRQLRGEKMSMIFQEPMTALNPVMTCGSQIDELLVQHTRKSARERRLRILEMLGHVRLADSERLYRSYPHQLSGGQRQRIMIAMALILAPALLIADEPTTALDVTTQADILRLIRELQRESNTTVLFITHDFGVVAEIADSVAVLQRGRLVESGPARDVLTRPQHPYTRALLKAVPSLTPRKPAPERTRVIHLQTRHLTKVFESGGWLRRRPIVKAIDGIDLEVCKGDTVGIVGESGSGKSTLARLLVRLVEPSGGEIEVDGRPVTLVARTGCPRVPAQGADGLSGPVPLAQPTPYGRRGHRGGPAQLRRHAGGRVAARGGTVGPGQVVSSLAPPVSTRVFRRATPAHLHRARARGRSGDPDRRRGGLGTRCFDPSPDSVLAR